ncbi:hypothetical protein GQ457_16G016540 [Hibiscus cannabinus]
MSAATLPSFPLPKTTSPLPFHLRRAPATLSITAVLYIALTILLPNVVRPEPNPYGTVHGRRLGDPMPNSVRTTLLFMFKVVGKLVRVWVAV